MVSAYVGEIRIFAGNYAPEGWGLCNGDLLAVSGHEALFSLIGYAYGGDGVANFALPDLRGRIPIGQGAGTGLTPRTIASKGGHETVALSEATLPAHTHPFNASTTNASSELPTNRRPAKQTGACLFYVDPATQGATFTDQQLAADAVQMSGGASAHPNMMPGLGLNYIIALIGDYPTPE